MATAGRDMATDDVQGATSLEFDLSITEGSSLGELFPRVYRELKQVARRQLVKAPGHSLNTTGLVHEVFFKLADLDSAVLENRAHFLAVSARAMRQVLVAAARKRQSLKRGGEYRHTQLTDAEQDGEVQLDEVLAVHDALANLRRLDERLVQVVECRFFAHLTEEETAEALDLSVSTVQRDWRRAKAWLRCYLEDSSLAGGE